MSVCTSTLKMCKMLVAQDSSTLQTQAVFV